MLFSSSVFWDSEIQESVSSS